MSDERTIDELDLVALERDVPEHGLRKGDIGTVVHCYSDGLAVVVEMMDDDGQTIAVLTLENADVRPLTSSELMHLRAGATS